MPDPARPCSAATWDALAPAFAASRQVSADQLIEWPAQRELAGDVQGKHILDLGCGTGDKARFFAEHGAASVLGIDASSGYAAHWREHAACPRLRLLQAGFDQIASLPDVAAAPLDLIVSFQALMYARDLVSTVRTIAALLRPGGAFVFSVPHPFRFAILRNEIEGWGHGFAYQQTAPYVYPSPWNPALSLEHAMPRVSDYLNALVSAGLRLTASREPAVSDDFRQASPEKAAWMDRYVGILLLRAERDSPPR